MKNIMKTITDFPQTVKSLAKAFEKWVELRLAKLPIVIEKRQENEELRKEKKSRQLDKSKSKTKKKALRTDKKDAKTNKKRIKFETKKNKK